VKTELLATAAHVATGKYEAYLYEITVNGTGKKYIGWHMGVSDGTYLHSSKCPIFAKDFAQNDNEYKILATGTAIAMATKEHLMLLEVNAKKNPDYYNKSNGGGKYVKAVKFTDIRELYQMIKKLGYPVKMTKKGLIVKLKRYQVRVDSTDTKHVQVLADAMMDMHGDISEFDPVIVLKGFATDGGDVILDGNHTTIAAEQVSHAVDIPVMYIEKDVWSQFDSTQLKILANLLNPQLEKAAKPGDVDDQVDWIVELFNKKGVPADAAENFEILKAMNFKTRQINTIIKKAKAKIEINDKLPAGWQWKVWNLYKAELAMIIENGSDKDSIAMAMSSGKFNFALLQDKLKVLIKAKSKKRHATVYITHPNWNTMQDWYKTHLSEHVDNVETWIAPKGFVVNFVSLEYKIKNALEDI